MEEIIQAIAEWQYIKELPAEMFGFQLKVSMQAEGDVYYIFSYVNEARHRSLTVYYHQETKEYKLKMTIGLTEFCDIHFICAGLERMEAILRQRMASALENMAVFRKENIDSIVIDKKILEWEYLSRWPETVEGFTLFIRPQEPARVINGSYIVFDYCDFESQSNFMIYYNIFRDEFFGEARVHMIPEMNYMFDSKDLDVLEEKLQLHLLERLKQIRAAVEGRKYDENSIDDCGF